MALFRDGNAFITTEKSLVSGFFSILPNYWFTDCMDFLNGVFVLFNPCKNFSTNQQSLFLYIQQTQSLIFYHHLISMMI